MQASGILSFVDNAEELCFSVVSTAAEFERVCQKLKMFDGGGPVFETAMCLDRC